MEEMIEQILKLHFEDERCEITGKIYCDECQYEWPCRTYLIVTGEQ